MTESTYVETTTTVETSSSAIQDKSLKKKKSKKSRNHDKENISVVSFVLFYLKVCFNNFAFWYSR